MKGNISKIKFGAVPVAKCSTSSDDSAKTASVDGFTLTDGASVYVDFEHDVVVHESIENITLNINGTGDKTMTFNGIDDFSHYYMGDLPQTMIYNGVRCLVTYCESADVYIVNSPEPHVEHWARRAFFDQQEEIESINTKITDVENEKVDKITIIDTGETTASITMNTNSEYRFATMVSLEVILPDDIPEDYGAYIVFTSGEVATEIIYPDSLKWSGDDVIDGVLTPLPLHRYNIGIWYDGAEINAVSRSVSV